MTSLSPDSIMKTISDIHDGIYHNAHLSDVDVVIVSAEHYSVLQSVYQKFTAGKEIILGPDERTWYAIPPEKVEMFMMLKTLILVTPNSENVLKFESEFDESFDEYAY